MDKKTVLITGCSEGGIGAAMARAFHDQGYHVFATLRKTAKAGSLAQLNNIDILELEVTSEVSIKECAQEVEKRTGGTLDVLVNNAGADFVIPLLDTSIDEAKKLYDLNVWSILAMTQAFASLLVGAKGTICNIGSVAAIVPLPWSGIYGSSKAAAQLMSETLRLELKPLGVRVVTAVVGSVHTPIHENAGELHLPADSYYRQIRDTINNWRIGSMKPGSEVAHVTARNIVHDIIGGRIGLIWRGGFASSCRYLAWLLPARLVDYMVSQNRGLSDIKRTEK
ncbi:putative short-chain dehydrogenase/reductase [Delphinella strobiligena]|nr:putative short-chain dehydrogenase/reductase [Delphinella strobiligena]